MAGTKTVYLSLGSNVGDRRNNLEQALAMLEAAGVRIVKRSSLYETAPRDVLDQPWFLNMVVEAETPALPLQFLTLLQRVERELGRNRGTGIRRGPRTIDLDILLFGRAAIDTPGLTIPHPRMTLRRFVLEPLVEIAPELRHPLTRRLFSDHLKEVRDQAVSKTET
jgi:2-amino-4-hydroxy-6-hydroxymethyldihydropteridine diphosphokinase